MAGHLPIVCISMTRPVSLRGDGIADGRGRTCWIPAICLVMYSTVTGSSTVSLWLWHSTRALSMRTRPSAFKPTDMHEHEMRAGRADKVLTSEGEAYVIVEHDNFPYCTRVL